MKYLIAVMLLFSAGSLFSQTTPDTLSVVQTNDFQLNSPEATKAWSRTNWTSLTQLDEGVTNYDTRFKMLYSATGIYVLFEGNDLKITGNYKEDFSDMYNADVFEVFFHPEPATPLYFEYEINAHDKELVLLIPNVDGQFMGWRPWHYEKDRLVKHIVKTTTQSGQMRSWTAELFFPYTLLAPLQKTPPQSGTIWNANFCRLDYDQGKMIKWSWSPIERSFHEFKKFNKIQFR